MYYEKLSTFIFVLNVLCHKITIAQVEGDDNCYAAEFTGKVKDCSGFENKKIVSTLSLAISRGSDDAEGELILSGELKLVDDINEDYQIEINVWKDLGTGQQFVYRADGNFCETMHKKDTPWRSLVEALDATKCPVVKGVYPVNDLTMSLDFAKSVLCREFCGDYVVKLSIIVQEEEVSCHEVSIAVEEVPCE